MNLRLPQLKIFISICIPSTFRGCVRLHLVPLNILLTMFQLPEHMRRRSRTGSEPTDSSERQPKSPRRQLPQDLKRGAQSSSGARGQRRSGGYQRQNRSEEVEELDELDDMQELVIASAQLSLESAQMGMEALSLLWSGLC